MSTRSKLASVIVLCIVLALVVWGVLNDSVHLPDSTLPQRPTDVSRLENVSGLDTTVGSPNREPAVAGAESTGTPGAIVAASSGFSGQFVFSDRSSAPRLTFRLAPLKNLPGESRKSLRDGAELARAQGGCVRWAVERTGVDGRFDVGNVCPGQYKLEISSDLVLMEPSASYTAPATDVVVLVDGFVVTILAIDAAGMIVPHCDVQLTRLDNGKPGVVARTRCDENGMATTYVRTPGTYQIRAAQGLTYSTPEELFVGGTTHHISQTVVLREHHTGAILSVVVDSCTEPGRPVPSYCLNFYETGTERVRFRLCSEDAELGGIFKNVEPGEYDVLPAPRYSDEPVMYSVEGAKRSHLALLDGTAATFNTCVNVGGRIGLMVVGDVQDVATSQKAIASITALDGGVGPIKLLFRSSSPAGISMSFEVPLNSRRVTEQVFAPGRYSLSVTVAGEQYSEILVNLVAGQVCNIDLPLR